MSGTILMDDPQTPVAEKQPLNTAKYEPSGLQVKLQKQRDRIRNTQPQSTPMSNGSKKSSLMSAARMQIPRSTGGYQRLDNSPLVTLESDSEDEIFLSYKQRSSARQVNKELSRQLAKDGYQLDEMPDDEDLDLIPPSDFRRPNYMWEKYSKNILPKRGCPKCHLQAKRTILSNDCGFKLCFT